MERSGFNRGACPVYPVAPEDGTGVKLFVEYERSGFNRGAFSLEFIFINFQS